MRGAEPNARYDLGHLTEKRKEQIVQLCDWSHIAAQVNWLQCIGAPDLTSTVGHVMHEQCLGEVAVAKISELLTEFVFPLGTPAVQHHPKFLQVVYNVLCIMQLPLATRRV